MLNPISQSKILTSVKLYKIIPGGKSPEEKAAIAGEIYVRLVEGVLVSEETLQALAGKRASAVYEELKAGAGIPPDRLAITDPEPSSGDLHPSARLSLDALLAEAAARFQKYLFFPGVPLDESVTKFCPLTRRRHINESDISVHGTDEPSERG